MKKLISMFLLALLVVFLVACGGENEPTQEQTSDSAAEDTAADESGDKKVDTDFADMTWEEVLAEAEGQTVTWYLWGGSTEINNFIDNVVAEAAAEYGITINRVGVSNITEAVNITIGEKQAGKDEGGTVDLFWINGSNFMMMQQADVCFENWSEQLPNAQYVDWTDPAIAMDMGLPVNGQESPWMSAQLQMIYDSSRISEDELPRTYADLLEWCKNNPGRFTYVAPPEFIGTRFIKQGLYELTGGYEDYESDDISIEEFEEMAAPIFEYLEELAPYLWREGTTYAKTESDLQNMLSNNEVDFAFTMNGMGIKGSIDTGQLPETAKVYCMDTAIADTNYVATSYNSSNKAGALVIANILLDPAIQAQNIIDTAGAPVLNFSTLSDAQLAVFGEATDTLGEGTFVPAEELERTKAPEVSSYLNTYIEELWARLIGSGG